MAPANETLAPAVVVLPRVTVPPPVCVMAPAIALLPVSVKLPVFWIVSGPAALVEILPVKENAAPVSCTPPAAVLVKVPVRVVVPVPADWRRDPRESALPVTL